MLSHEKLVETILAKPAVKEAYETMGTEFAFWDELLRPRRKRA